METDIQEIQIACFKLGNDLFAIDIMRIKEIIRPQKLAALPKALPFVEGVINLRGLVIPVVDLRRRFDMPERTDNTHTRLLIVTVARQLLGLEVDDVTEVVTVAVKDIKPPPQMAGGVGAEYLIGVCLARDSLVMLLNIDRLLSNLESGQLLAYHGG